MTDDGVAPAGVCQHPRQGVSENRFWADHPRADLRDRAWRRIRETAGYGLKFSKLVEELHGREAIEQSTYDYKHLNRFVGDLRREGYVRIERIGPQERPQDRPQWIFPTVTANESVFNNTVSGISEHRGKSARTGDESVAVARKNAAGILRRRRTLDTAAEWGELVGAFGAKRIGEDAGDCQPTRFNTVERARKSLNRLAVAFAGARALDHVRGVVVTATTDPGRFDSIGTAAGGLLDDVNRLRRKVGRPPGVTVVEPTKRGVGHAHIALFGVDVSDLPSKHELHRYWWETRERGHQVDMGPIVDAGESWVWTEQASAAVGGCPPDAYLQEGPMSVVTVAHLDGEEVLEVADSYRARGDAVTDAEGAAAVDAEVAAETGVEAGTVRRAAWYFGTGLKTVTRPSKVLRAALENSVRGDGAC